MKIVNRPTSDKFVYHYTQFDTAYNHILQSGTILFNPLALVNDPREAKPWDIITTVEKSTKIETSDWVNLSRGVSDLLKSNIKLACFSSDKVEIDVCDIVDNVIYRGYSRPAMWHHYADQHRGLCLMFDKEKLLKAFERQTDRSRLSCGRVVYSDSGFLPELGNYPFHIDLRFARNDSDIQALVAEHGKKWQAHLFFQKLRDWESENEYRFILFGENPEAILMEFEDALEGVIVGSEVSPEDEEKLLLPCVKFRAEIAQLKWRNGYPTISRPGQPYISHKHLLNT